MLPQGEFDVPLMVRDVIFGPDGELGFNSNSESGRSGDVILASGVPWPVMRVKRRIYRFRVLAAAISRSWRFQLNDGDPMVIVGTDGGLVPRPQTVSGWRQGVAERYEVLIHFARYQPGERVILRNLSNPNSIDFADTDLVMAFDVTDEPFDHGDPTWNTIPDRLATDPCTLLKPSDAVRTAGSTSRTTAGSGGSTGGPGRTSSPATSSSPRPPGAERHRDLGAVQP